MEGAVGRNGRRERTIDVTARNAERTGWQCE